MTGCASRVIADEDFERYRKATRRDQFLAEMEQIIPWRELCKVIKPFYPTSKGAGRPPIGLERMLRIHFLQHWFNLSDPEVEEALYDSRSMRHFVGIDLGHEPAPDETTICKFRHQPHLNNRPTARSQSIRSPAHSGTQVSSSISAVGWSRCTHCLRWLELDTPRLGGCAGRSMPEGLRNLILPSAVRSQA